MTTAPWTCVIPGDPVPKGRPRATTINGRARLYTPRRTALWEAHACSVLAMAWGGRPPLSGPVRLYVLALFERPQRLRWRRRPMPQQPHVGRPDADNIVKAVGDAIERAGVVANDSMICDVRIRKVYCAAGERPCVMVTIQAAPAAREE